MTAERFGMVPLGALADMDGAETKVYAALAGHADNAGYCWPSQVTLAAVTGLDRRRVQRALSRLRKSGLVALDAPGSGRRSTRYWLPSQPRRGGSSNAASRVRRGGTSVTPGAVPVSTQGRYAETVEAVPMTVEAVLVTPEHSEHRNIGPNTAASDSTSTPAVNGEVSADPSPSIAAIAAALGARFTGGGEVGLHRADDEERARAADVIAEARRKLDRP